MINTAEYDNRLRQELPSSEYWDYEREVRKRENNDHDSLAVLKRNELFWSRRYQVGSYKARKAGISRPSVMMN